MSLKHFFHECSCMEMAQVPIDGVKDAKAQSWNNYKHIFRNKLLFPFFYQVFIQKVIPQIRFSNFNNPISFSVRPKDALPSLVVGLCLPGWEFPQGYGSRVGAGRFPSMVTWDGSRVLQECHPSKSQGAARSVTKFFRKRDSQMEMIESVRYDRLCPITFCCQLSFPCSATHSTHSTLNPWVTAGALYVAASATAHCTRLPSLVA